MTTSAWPVPANEKARLAELRSFDILDTAPEPAWDDLAMLAAHICGTPIGLVNFVDAERQWGKALVGLEDSEAPRAVSFCARSIMRPEEVFVVPDTTADPAWAENPMVTGDPNLRFYAGAPIVTPTGAAVGTVCVAAPDPATLDPERMEALQALARMAASQLELRSRAVRLEQFSARLGHLATHDELTGLGNRTLLHDRLEHALERAERSKRLLAVLAVDLNDFKAINDTHGHAAGDLTLVHAARRMRRAARPMDTVVRAGGDEFVLVCEELVEAEHADRIARRVDAALRAPVPLSDVQLEVSASVGVVVGRFGDTVDDLLARADAAMCAVKQQART